MTNTLTVSSSFLGSSAHIFRRSAVLYWAIRANPVNSEELLFAPRTCPTFRVRNSATPGGYPLQLDARLSHTHPFISSPFARLRVRACSHQSHAFARFPFLGVELTAPPTAIPAGGPVRSHRDANSLAVTLPFFPFFERQTTNATSRFPPLTRGPLSACQCAAEKTGKIDFSRLRFFVSAEAKTVQSESREKWFTGCLVILEHICEI